MVTFTNIYHQYIPNVSIYTSTMDPMGYDRLGEATFEKGRETATSPSLFLLLFLTLCHTQMTKQANKHFTICKNLYANIMRYVYIYTHT